jgi:hypothetical protein
MKHTLKALVLASVMGAGSLFMAAPAEAQHYRGSSVGVYIETPGVAVRYRSGYYDRYHRWHRYHRYPARYYRHDRGHHYGWYRHHRRQDWRCRRYGDCRRW